MDYGVDPLRQGIADSWPRRIDDSVAREEWGWSPEYDIGAMTAEMVAHLRQRESVSSDAPNPRPTVPR